MTISRCLVASFLSFIIFTISDALAADHIDGPAVKKFTQADILDFFAFTSPDRARLILAMTLVSDADDDATFDANISYRFRLRKGNVIAEGHDRTRRVRLSAGLEEDVITCGPTETGSGEKQKIKCELNRTSCGGECLAQEVAVNFIPPENLEGFENPDEFKVFAGLVHDPFFSNVTIVRTLRPQKRSGETFSVIGNPFEDRNALALVIEVPLKALKFESGVLATIAETYLLSDRPDTKAKRIDRMGNVEITNFLLCFRPIKKWGIPLGTNQTDFPCAQEREIIKDWYNSDDTFNVSADHIAIYENWFGIGLRALDWLDSDTDSRKIENLDWPPVDTGDGIKRVWVWYGKSKSLI